MSNPLFQDDDSDDPADEPVADTVGSHSVVAAASPHGRQTTTSAGPPATSPPLATADLKPPTTRQQVLGHAERVRSPVMSPSVETIKAVAGSMHFETSDDPIPQAIDTFLPIAGLVHRASLGLMNTPGRLRFPLRRTGNTGAPVMISLDSALD